MGWSWWNVPPGWPWREPFGEDVGMSNLGPAAGGNRRPPGVPTPPRGEPIARYATYLEAQRAVDYLSDSHFPVQFVTIVGTDLRMVERVTGRLTYARVAMAGLASGAWFGLFVGLLLSIFSSGAELVPLGTAILVGAGFGMLFGVVSYAFTGGRRDFRSTSQIVASEYQVLCLAEQAQRARELLIQLERSPGMAGLRPPGPGPAGPVAGNPYAPAPPTGSYPGPYQQPVPPPPPSGGVNPYGAPGAAVPPPPPPGSPAPQTPAEETPAAPPTGPTYGEVMAQRRQEQKEKELRERREKLERERAAAGPKAEEPRAQEPRAEEPRAEEPKAEEPGAQEPPSTWQEPGSSQPSGEPGERRDPS
jgi:hypothetical protein